MNRRIYKLLFFCMVSMLSVFVHAANTLQVTYQIGNTQKVTSFRTSLAQIRNNNTHEHYNFAYKFK